MTARALNRATLGRQLLLRREPLGVPEAVRRVVALQAQEVASPYLALWNRVSDLDPADVDAAFAGYRVVKATLMRMTLHAVHADDYPAFRAAIEPTLHATHLNGRFTPDGLELEEAEALVRDLLELAGRPRTAEELKGRFGRAWGILRSYTPLVRVPTGGTWAFDSRVSYVAARVQPALEQESAALQVLVRRYLAGFGPASVADIAQFALVQQARVKAALRALVEVGAVMEMEGPLFDLVGAPLPAEDTPAPPRLMAMWDQTLLAYADRARVVPPAYRKLVMRSNGDVLPTLLVDGYVAGVWRPVEGGIEATAFHSLPGEVWDALAAEAEGLTALLGDREPHVYRRYHRWWATLPGVQSRILPSDTRS